MPETTYADSGRAPVQWLQALIVSLAIVTLVWCYAYHRWTPEAWSTPIVYSGDALQWLSSAKAQATGEIHPILPKFPPSLGAPFVANWNDYPTPEEGPLALLGFLARLFGLFRAANLTVLCAHLLAAGSFLFVCWQLRYNLIFSAAGAILFALSRYAFFRGFSHMPLTYYWHVPLGFLVAYWCLKERISPGSKKFWCGVGVAILFGIHNPYYSGIFLQFLGGVVLLHLVRRAPWRQIAVPLVLAAVLAGTFALVNLDTFHTRHVEGHNLGAVIRGYPSLEVYALKPIELLVPMGHRLYFVEKWARRGYFDRAHFLGEAGGAYLGLAGIVALSWLLWLVLKSVAGRKDEAIPLHLWGILWVGAYSIVGGINGFVGAFGLFLFRGSNRYSIVILALLLFFLVRQLSAVSRRWTRPVTLLFALLLIGIGIWDQTPVALGKREIANLHKKIEEDAAFVSELESRLPPGAMIFQLPIMGFPEVGPTLGVGDYELFRPYLFSHHLRFSYGSNKGRTRERWQKEALQLGTTAFVDLLERYGFSALFIARAGYADKAAALVGELRGLGRSEILAASPEFLCIALRPSPRPIWPPEFGSNWLNLEGNAKRNWRWSSGNAGLVLHNFAGEQRSIRLTFAVETLQPRHLRIALADEVLTDINLDPASPSAVDVSLAIAPGKNVVRFETDIPGTAPPGSKNKLAYHLVNFQAFESD